MRISSIRNDPSFDPTQVKMIACSDPIAGVVRRIYQRFAGKVPLHLQNEQVNRFGFEEIYIVRGPSGEYEMSTGRETLHHIIDEEAAFFERNGVPPRKMKLPVLMAYDLAKCGGEDLGDLSGRVFKDGINVFEKEGFHGMQVEIVRKHDAELAFE
jgi:hypothetical protein